MNRANKVSRRDFLVRSGRTAAAVGAGSILAGAASRTVRSAPIGPAGTPRKIGANDQIRVGLIGSGGQGTHDARMACLADNVVCVALCDVAEFRLAMATRVLTDTMKEKGHDGVKIDHYGDYRKLLDRKDVDAVIIATPDFWHTPPFVAATEAGKHIYQEKPMCYTIEQGLEMLAAAAKCPELTIQIGTQRRSGTHYPKARKLIEDGVIGEVNYVRAYDCRNYISGPDPFSPEFTAKRFQNTVGGTLDWKTAKLDWDQFQAPCSHKVPFDPWRYCAWRWYWDYAGGLVTDVGVHVMDVVHWLTGNPTPKSAVCNGGVYGLEYWETPDVVNAVWDYGTHTVAFTSNFTNGYEGDGLTIFGTKGAMEVRGAHIYVWPEGKRDQPSHEFPAEGSPHQHNWIRSIRTGDAPVAPIALGFSSLLPSHLANLAYRRGTKVYWDPDAKKVS